MNKKAKSAVKFGEWIIAKTTDDTSLKPIGKHWYWCVNKYGSTMYTTEELYKEFKNKQP